jgi:hypothetical protein
MMFARLSGLGFCMCLSNLSWKVGFHSAHIHLLCVHSVCKVASKAILVVMMTTLAGLHKPGESIMPPVCGVL